MPAVHTDNNTVQHVSPVNETQRPWTTDTREDTPDDSQHSPRPRLHYRLLALCPAPTDPVGQSWPRDTGSVGDIVGERVRQQESEHSPSRA